jgi:hypothetical protein
LKDGPGALLELFPIQAERIVKEQFLLSYVKCDKSLVVNPGYFETSTP